MIKETVKERIREIAVRYQLTTLIVTHDPEEAMTLSDRILLLSDGKVAQFAEPAEIIHNPASDFVTNYILNQLNIKRRNILSLFADGISEADPLSKYTQTQNYGQYEADISPRLTDSKAIPIHDKQKSKDTAKG